MRAAGVRRRLASEQIKRSRVDRRTSRVDDASLFVLVRLHGMRPFFGAIAIRYVSSSITAVLFDRPRFPCARTPAPGVGAVICHPGNDPGGRVRPSRHSRPSRPRVRIRRTTAIAFRSSRSPLANVFPVSGFPYAIELGGRDLSAIWAVESLAPRDRLDRFK